MADNNTLPETGFVRLPTILALIPVSKSTFWVKVKTGEFPRPYKLGPNITAWRAEDIRTLIDSFSQCADPDNISDLSAKPDSAERTAPAQGGQKDGE